LLLHLQIMNGQTKRETRSRWLSHYPARSLRSPLGAVLLNLSLGALLSSYAQADNLAAERAHGEHIARLICSSCHIVAKDQEFPPILNWPTPSFFDIANRPGVSVKDLQRFITETHWDMDKLPMTMPNPQLTKEQTQAVAEYILSLRSPSTRALAP
jgi:mono/diheme cytochrome c family protein